MANTTEQQTQILMSWKSIIKDRRAVTKEVQPDIKPEALIKADPVERAQFYNKMKNMPYVRIGIDPGVHTGIAILRGNKMYTCRTIRIDEAMEIVLALHESVKDIHVTVEDARQRGEARGILQAKAQGAGSVKRDCKIWDDLLKAHEIPHWLRPPIQNGTRYRDQIFASTYPYWKGRTSEHARSAANLLI